MKRIQVTVLLVVMASIAFAAQEWTKSSPAGCRCSILTPVKLEETIQPVDTKAGRYDVHIFEGITGAIVYAVAWVDYAATMNVDVQGELEANRDNFVKGINARLVETTQISLKGIPGIQFTAEKDTQFFTSRVYVIDRRPYQLMVVTRKGEDHAAEISRFFNSFETTAGP